MPKGKNPTKKAKGTTRAVAGLDPVKTETALSPVSAVEVQDGPGRPTKFKQEFIQQAQALCDLGATDEEMAAFFQVDTRTLYRWKLDNEEFCQAIKAGKSRADDRIERSLFQKASGFYFKEEQAIKIKSGQFEETVEVVPVERYAPPDTTAMIFWLKNRRKVQWRDKQEVEVEAKGAITVRHKWGGNGD